METAATAKRSTSGARSHSSSGAKPKNKGPATKKIKTQAPKTQNQKALKKAKKGPLNRRVTKTLETQKQPRTSKQLAWWLTKWVAVVTLAMIALGSATIAFMFWWYGRDPNMPGVDDIMPYQPRQVTRIVAADGEPIGEVYTQRRTYVPYEQIPEVLINAVVAAEDAHFWEHKGIDYGGMVRALYVNLRSGKAKEGASTITQQVVKTFLLSPEKTLKRKFQEIILARRLERKLTKQEILELYLNQIYFGSGRYGVQEAARYYFGKNVQDINIGEAALLAGLPQSPGRYTPRKKKNHEAAKDRQVYVLRAMARNNFITHEEAERWVKRPIEIVRRPFPHLGEGPEYVDIAKAELVARFGEEAIDRLGGEVTTTLDRDVQADAVEALRASLREVDARNNVGRAVRKVRPDKIGLELAKFARRMSKKNSKLKAGKRYEAIVLEVHDADNEVVVDAGAGPSSVLLGGEADARYNPEGIEASKRFAIGDVIRIVAFRKPPDVDEDDVADPKHSKARVSLEPGAQGAVVVIDPKTRYVIAMVGGYDMKISGFNRATMAKRQAGSTFKPFVYAAAIDTGEYAPSTIVNDAPEVYDLWKPKNYKRGKHAGPVRLRYALAASINTVAIRVAYDVGPKNIASLARAMGIQSKLPHELSLALGSGEVTPLELTNAFATFAAGGKYAPPVFVSEVHGERVDQPSPVEALRPEVAYVVADMMRSVVRSGTGRKAKALRLNVAGKTGTSNDARDAWFIGMTPDLVVGVWVGHDDNSTLGRRESGSKTALPVYVKLLKKLRKRLRLRAKKFVRPGGVETARIDKATGKLAPSGASPKDTYTEVFITGSVPTEVAPAPGEADENTYILDQYEDDEPAPASPGDAAVP